MNPLLAGFLLFGGHKNSLTLYQYQYWSIALLAATEYNLNVMGDYKAESLREMKKMECYRIKNSCGIGNTGLGGKTRCGKWDVDSAKITVQLCNLSKK